MAKDVLGIVVGIPLLFAGIFVWMWAMKRLFFGYRVLDRVEGKTKIYKDHDPVSFRGDARFAAGAACYCGLIAYVIVFICIIF